ncbi:Serine/threonine-protein kinase dclk3 [Tulasnella sp. 427]|nr:Serine/threonine-protein kinase dclk3 [Tulasnella sp. 427]
MKSWNAKWAAASQLVILYKLAAALPTSSFDVAGSPSSKPAAASQPYLLTGLWENLPLPHFQRQEHVDFGSLQCIKDPTRVFPLKMASNEFDVQQPSGQHLSVQRISIGSAAFSDIVITGSGIYPEHCFLSLELGISANGHFFRRVVVERADEDESRPGISIMAENYQYQLRARKVLPVGARICFGNGPWFKYEGPKFEDLYGFQDYMFPDDDSDDGNSRIMKVERLGDRVQVICKIIKKTCKSMARKELAVFDLLIPQHPNIVEFVESFSDKDENKYYLILERAEMDLARHASRLRRHHEQPTLTSQSSHVTAQISSGIAGIAHRDLKPENILISRLTEGKVTAKLCDFGLARMESDPAPGDSV